MDRPIVGVTTPIFVPRDGMNVIEPGKDYFILQVHGAQVSFRGSIWEKVQRLVVSSQVNLNHATLGKDPLKALQRSREVERNRAEQLGLRPNLVDLVPAVMPNISLSIDYLLDKENRLAAIGGLINDDSFLAAVSLAPAAATVAKTIGGLAQKVLQTFVPAKEREPILQFSGDFNIAGGELREGFYVILGTRDEETPIPNPLPRLEVSHGALLADGKPVTQLSYVILDFRRVAARTRELNGGAAWDARLRDAEDLAQNIGDDALGPETAGDDCWQKCRDLLRDAQALLREDLSYHRWEANTIVRTVYQRCRDLAGGEQDKARMRGGPLQGAPMADSFGDRRLLDIPADVDLAAVASTYAEQVASARKVLDQVAARPH